MHKINPHGLAIHAQRQFDGSRRIFRKIIKLDQILLLFGWNDSDPVSLQGMVRLLS